VLQQQGSPLLADILKDSPIPLPTFSPPATASQPSPEDSPTQAGRRTPPTGGGGGGPTPSPPPGPGNPSITTTAVNPGEVTVPYQAVGFLATGGAGPYSYSASGVPGLLFSGSNLQGTPSTDGTYTLVVQVTDSGGRTGTKSFPGLVIYKTLGMTSPAFHPGEVGVIYSPTVQLSAAGTGSGTYTWQVMAPSGLTTGPTAGTTFNVGGTAPTATGPITVKVSDAFTSVTRTFISIAPHVALAAQTLPKGRATPPTVYPQTGSVAISVVGGTGVGPFTYTISAGALPPGVLLNPTTGAISGTTGPLIGTYDFTVKVTDSLGGIDTRGYQIVVTATGT
jgi:hypothetical protein